MKLNFRLLQLNFRLLQLNFRLLQLNFRFLQLNFSQMKLNFRIIIYQYFFKDKIECVFSEHTLGHSLVVSAIYTCKLIYLCANEIK